MARALEALPLTCGEFRAGRLSYAKVRALSRIATPDTEAELVEMATPMTAGQLERFVRAHRQASGDGSGGARPDRRLGWHFQDEHEFSFKGHLPPQDGAIVLQALRAARNDLEHPHDGVSAETRLEELNDRDKQDGITWNAELPPGQRSELAADLADALVEVCAAYLRDKARHADNPDVYQVIVHAGVQTVTEEGYRCRFPGCESRRTDAHHIRYWGNGGETSLLNLISLCKTHHKTVHAKDITIASEQRGFTFYTREGTPVPVSPGLPEISGDITRCHESVITPDTIIPPNSGERLDLNLAVWVCLANARIKAAGETAGPCG